MSGRRLQGGGPHGHVALVTGAAKRIGREVALELAEAGFHVVVNYKTSHGDAKEVVERIRALGVESLAYRADVSSPVAVRSMFERIDKRFGRLDLLVNNAGIFYPAKWDRLTTEDWDRILGTNLKGPFFCAQAAAKLMMRTKRGHIINISSLGGIQAWPGYMHYCSSKAGLIMLTKCLAKALAPHILVNSIAPGTILFPGEERNPEMMKIVRSTPLKKGGDARDIASIVVFLAVENKFMTGQLIVADGGKSIA